MSNLWKRDTELHGEARRGTERQRNRIASSSLRLSALLCVSLRRSSVRCGALRYCEGRHKLGEIVVDLEGERQLRGAKRRGIMAEKHDSETGKMDETNTNRFIERVPLLDESVGYPRLIGRRISVVDSTAIFNWPDRRGAFPIVVKLHSRAVSTPERVYSLVLFALNYS